MKFLIFSVLLSINGFIFQAVILALSVSLKVIAAFDNLTDYELSQTLEFFGERKN